MRNLNRFQGKKLAMFFKSISKSLNPGWIDWNIISSCQNLYTNKKNISTNLKNLWNLLCDYREFLNNNKL